jgi:hypothetical protein
MREAYDIVRHNDIKIWGNEFMTSVNACRKPAGDTALRALVADVI